MTIDINNYDNIEQIKKDFFDGLTSDGLFKVQSGSELQASFLKKPAKPEEYTKLRLIEPILELFGCKVEGREVKFKAPKNTEREVDYTISTSLAVKYIIEAKPINADLFSKNTDGCINQVRDALILQDVVKNYGNGIATDGMRWIFIDDSRNIIADYDICKNYNDVESILVGGTRPLADKEEISNKFYKWYSALLFGGKYVGHDGKSHGIPESECLINSITTVSNDEEREKIAQMIIDRLIFIKFLESKGIIKNEVTDYLCRVKDDGLNQQLKSLFFNVMSTKKEERVGVNHEFIDIPYLNGSLFTRTQAEIDNADYLVKPQILREILGFLSSFTFESKKEVRGTSLDPEILGYIFEMSMNSQDRKGTGAFYTPREITQYMSKEAINNAFLNKVKEHLALREYKQADIDEINSVDDIYNKLSDIMNNQIFNEILPKFSVCDNACGSGAFLLAAADTLCEIYIKVNNKAGLRNPEVALKKLILSHNLYGVDLNQNAVEIAKLRLWLWLVNSYRVDYSPALPNIDYNIRCGNSLIGLLKIDEFKTLPSRIEDFLDNGKTVAAKLKRRQEKIETYRNSTGAEAKEIKKEIDSEAWKIRDDLTNALYSQVPNKQKLSLEELIGAKPFHWGFEFNDIMERGGFDVIIGNPPFIQLQKMKKKSETRLYKTNGYEVHSDEGDIYCLFFERSDKLLCKGGVLSYITSNKWMKVEYGEKLRDYFISNTIPIELIDFPKMRIFKDATVESCIFTFVANKEKNDASTINVSTCEVPSKSDIEKMSDFVKQHRNYCTFSIGKSWSIMNPMDIQISKRIEAVGKPLKDWDIEINYGIKTGLNPAFLIDEGTRKKIIDEDPKSDEIIRPILQGRDIQRYVVGPIGQYIIATFPSKEYSIDDYPGVKKYFESADWSRADRWIPERYGPPIPHGMGYYRLEQSGKTHALETVTFTARKKTSNKWYETQDPIGYWANFSKQKLIWKRIGSDLRFAVDEGGCFGLDSTCIATGVEIKYLCLILNSKMGKYILRNSPRTGVGDLLISVQALEPIIVPMPSPTVSKQFEQWFDDIVLAIRNGENTEEIIRRADEAIYEIYKLNQDERAYVSSYS